MNKRIFCFFAFLLLFFNVISQAHQDTIKKYESCYWRVCTCIVPDSLTSIGQFEASIKQLKSDTNQQYYFKCYQIAVNYALLHEVDSAYFYLHKFIETSPDDRMLYVDTRWDVLRDDTVRWKILIDKMQEAYLNCLDSVVDKKLALRLFYLGILDQKYRVYWGVLKQFPTDSAGYALADADQRYLFEQTFEIYNTYGFPGISMVGKSSSSAAFLLLQHSPYIKQYYHTIKKAFEKSDINPEQYAMCTDRFLVQNRKKQIYGTQFYSDNKTKKKYGDCVLIRPVKDYKHLNYRRGNIGLYPIENSMYYKIAIFPKRYLKCWNKQKSN